MAILDRCGNHIRIQIEPEDKVLELGRQTRVDPPPFAIVKSPDATRLVIVAKEQTEIGRRQLKIEVLGTDRLRLSNVNETNSVSISALKPGAAGSVTFATEAALGPGESVELSMPLSVIRGSIQLYIERAGQEPAIDVAGTSEFQSLAAVPQSPNAVVSTPGRFFAPEAGDSDSNSSFRASIRSSNTNQLIDRLGQLVTALQRAASASDFEEVIARTAMEMVDLDRTAVLRRDGERWENAALVEQREGGAGAWRPSQGLLNQMVRDRRTVWGAPGTKGADPFESVMSVVAVVAAPILNEEGEITGALYGDRRLGIGLNRNAIDKFDAKMVEIMACGVAGGWARLEQEKAAAARRAQFERFVTKEVAQRLEEDPELLIGKDAEVTMLFCDITGFSRISEQLNPEQTFKWINQVMQKLSECVLETKGTLVDYVGDELIAMWGAPVPVADHAAAAAETAIRMLTSLKELNERFPLPGGELTQVGIGLNSGKVRVGNTGSQHKLKYGPLGSDVNIASRVQGATRYLRTPALITGATASRLGPDFCTRRLCSVRLKNIENPVELYELRADAGLGWNQLVEEYESALKMWEKRELKSTIEKLSQLIAKASHDGPTMVLLARAVDVWSRDLREYDPVWTLPSK